MLISNVLSALKSNRLLVIGVALLLFSYFPVFLPNEYQTNLPIFISVAISSLGIIVVSEYVTIKFAKYSLVGDLRKSSVSLLRLLLVGLFGGLILDGIMMWLGKLWIYPYWDIGFYALVFVPGFAFYFFTLVEAYLACKVLIDRLVPGHKFITKRKKVENKIFWALFYLGLIFGVIGTFILALGYAELGAYVFSVNTFIDLNDLNVLLGVGLLFGSAVLILEFILYLSAKQSFVLTLIHGYFNPTLAIILASVVLIIFMEGQNMLLLFWEYKNVLFEDIQLLSLPILGVIAWPIHYVFLINLFRLILKPEGRHFYAGDRL